MVDMALGGGVDIGRASVGALIELKGSIDSLCKSVDKLHALYLRQENRYQIQNQNFVALGAAATSDAAQDPVVFDLGGPGYGRMWEVRQLVIGGVTWASSAAGNAVVSVSPSQPLPATSPALTGIQDHAATLPSVAFYSAGQFRVRHPNHIFIVVLTPAATTVYTVGGDAYDMLDMPAQDVFTS